ncbi:MAG: ABC transporter permease, partial [Chloroflexota bacterium]|nr:ABC transporter permease [Chloroflexota bacterium]
MRWARLKALVGSAALGALASPLRSLLAALAAAAGTAALVGFLAVDEGSRQQQARRIDSLGANLIIVRPSAGGELTIEDAHALTDAARLPAVRLVAPELALPGEMAFEGLTANVTVLGTTPEYFAMRGLALRTGRFVTEQDQARAAPVAVVGERVRDLIFPNVSRSARPAALNGRPVSVVGYLEPAAGTANAPLDRTVVVPLDALRLKLADGGGRGMSLTAISIQAADAASLDDAAAQVSEALEQRVGAGRFTVTSQADMREAFRDAADDYRALLGALAAIGLGLAAVVLFGATAASAAERRVELA